MPRKTTADPTGQRSNRIRTTKRLQRRVRNAKRAVVERFRKIPTMVVNADLVYRYDMTPEQKEDFFNEVRRIIALEVVGTTQTDRVPVEWWFKPDLELPVRQGTLSTVVNLNQIIKISNVKGIPGRNGMPAQIVPVELVLTSQDYMRVLNEKYLSGFNAIKTLSDRTADQVIQRINAGVQAGNTPKEISEEISERFNVSQSSAKRTVDTEIGTAYNDARLQATEMVAQQTGFESGVIHLSALKVTTRQTHAARHGNLYSIQEQLTWWNEGANRINCFCSTESVLIDKNGNVIEK